MNVYIRINIYKYLLRSRSVRLPLSSTKSFMPLNESKLSKLVEFKSMRDSSLGSTPNDDDVYFKKNTTRVSQNLILHKNTDQPK
jgi:hypothetical protein